MAFDIAILKYGLGWSLLQKQLSVFILIPLASKRELRIFSSNLMGCQSEEIEANYGILPGTFLKRASHGDNIHQPS
jgi:hypothetical protein